VFYGPKVWENVETIRRVGKRVRGGGSAFPSNLFNALNHGDGEGAMLAFREEAVMPDGAPSPRAQESMDNADWLVGEWSRKAAPRRFS
jgi:hypothetical protein